MVISTLVRRRISCRSLPKVRCWGPRTNMNSNALAELSKDGAVFFDECLQVSNLGHQGHDDRDVESPGHR